MPEVSSCAVGLAPTTGEYFDGAAGGGTFYNSRLESTVCEVDIFPNVSSVILRDSLLGSISSPIKTALYTGDIEEGYWSNVLRIYDSASPLLSRPIFGMTSQFIRLSHVTVWQWLAGKFVTLQRETVLCSSSSDYWFEVDLIPASHGFVSMLLSDDHEGTLMEARFSSSSEPYAESDLRSLLLLKIFRTIGIGLGLVTLAILNQLLELAKPNLGFMHLPVKFTLDMIHVRMLLSSRIFLWIRLTVPAWILSYLGAGPLVFLCVAAMDLMAKLVSTALRRTDSQKNNLVDAVFGVCILITLVSHNFSLFAITVFWNGQRKPSETDDDTSDETDSNNDIMRGT